MNRRSLLLGIGATLAAPAIVKAESLMKIARLREGVDYRRWFLYPGDGWIGPTTAISHPMLLEAALQAQLIDADRMWSYPYAVPDPRFPTAQKCANPPVWTPTH